MGVAYCISVAEYNSKKNHLHWYVNVLIYIMLIVCVKHNYIIMRYLNALS